MEDTEQTTTPESTNVLVHPYLEEIMKCPNDWQLEKEEPVAYKSWEETPYTMVDTKELFDEMMAKLREEEEIALAVRGSNYRSFKKKNCLIPIATRSEVFLVDTLALKEDVKLLNEVLTNSSVLKVAHTKDAYCREFQQNNDGLYMVNAFCLPIADKILNNKDKEEAMTRWNNTRALQVLLKEYCGVEYNQSWKDLQDWHERPLPDEYVKCARVTVQYLLTIYDKFRNQLIDQNSLKKVYEECNKMCSVVWQPSDKKLHTPRSYLSLYKRLGEGWKGSKEKQLNKVQLEVLRVVYDWRYATAEKHDEGLLYLLKDLAIYNIAKALPKDVEEIKKALSPDTPCPLLEENLDTVCELIVKAVEDASGAPDAEEKVQFWKPKNSEAGNKRKQYQQKVQTYMKKMKGQQQPYYGGRGAPRFGQPQYPMHYPMMGPQMGFMYPRMGFMYPRMGFMRPWGMYGMYGAGMGARMPMRPFGW